MTTVLTILMSLTPVRAPLVVIKISSSIIRSMTERISAWLRSSRGLRIDRVNVFPPALLKLSRRILFVEIAIKLHPFVFDFPAHYSSFSRKFFFNCTSRTG
ncbi:hypothetical protein DSY0700 [Desulfitobacterium hafniense Y51]|uniref:Uncharacterized protein n=1 Tax=Desulfitobacterium hafniense (strain Y51) TaxID=138119 RepID=Q24ZQ3_DESHY|nr:hypothetical protein DSY0700 [Desulfitobacterium hafniense Y51]